MKSSNTQDCHLHRSLEAEASQKWSPMQRTGPGILPTFVCLRKGERKEGDDLQTRKSSASVCLRDSPPKTLMQLLACKPACLLTMPASLQHPPRHQGMCQPPSSILPGPRRGSWGVSFVHHNSVVQLIQMAGYMSWGHDTFGQAGAWRVPCTVRRESMRGQ